MKISTGLLKSFTTGTGTRIAKASGQSIISAINKKETLPRILDLVKSVDPTEVKPLIKFMIADHANEGITKGLLKKADENKLIDAADYRELLRFSIITCRNNPKTISIVLKKLEEVSEVKKDEYSALLHFSIKHLSAPEIIREFIEKGADVNAPLYGESPLLSAIDFGNSPEVIALLLEKGAKIDAVDHHGKNYLHFAAEKLNFASKLSDENHGPYMEKILKTIMILAAHDSNFSVNFTVSGSKALELININPEHKNLFEFVARTASGQIGTPPCELSADNQQKYGEMIKDLTGKIISTSFSPTTASQLFTPKQVDAVKGI